MAWLQLRINTTSENAEIIGVDIVASAIADAKENAQRNGVEGVQFFSANFMDRFLLWVFVDPECFYIHYLLPDGHPLVANL